jgi:hypothetical protein
MLTEDQNQRDRDLARDTGILIGYNRAAARKRERDRAFARGFLLGFLLTLFLFAAATIGAERAYGHHSTTKAKPIHQSLHGGKKRERPMPHPDIIRALIKVGQCEQPAPRGLGYYANVKWDAFPGKTWPGGLGIMQVHHDRFRPKGTPKDPTKATPAQQIRVAWRAYKYYRAEGRRLGYGDGTRYGSTFWECSRKMRPAFRGVAWDNRTVLWG